MTAIVNVNVGVLGHIDSGKTSLARALSSTASTACFDKCPQSQERGITVDLGFSSFQTPAAAAHPGVTLQFTLVDCPGHASLIRTIIGGAQIIDIMMLVVDITKGMQTQTAECLVLGEITAPKMIVVLNKIDVIEEDKRSSAIEKMRKKMQRTMEKTKFAGCPVLAVAARPSSRSLSVEVESAEPAEGLDKLVAALRDAADLPKRDSSGPFVFAVDHCFSIRGQGTVMTGTVLSGSVALGNSVEVPSIKEIRKVKSMQMFRKPVDRAIQGDRVGICVTQFDAKLLERGLLCSPPGIITTTYAAIVVVRPIRYFKGAILSKSKFHVSLGHSTVMASCHFFESVPINDDDNAVHVGSGCVKVDTESELQSTNFNWNREYAHRDSLLRKASDGERCEPPGSGACFALMQFERPVTVALSSLVIGSRLDADIHENSCRLAFEGRIVQGIDDRSYPQTLLPRLKVFKVKSKEGIVERLVNPPYGVIVRSLFKKEANLQHFVGMKVRLSSGETGVIEGSFGQSGKIKIRISEGLKEATLSRLDAMGKRRDKRTSTTTSGSEVEVGGSVEPVRVTLTFRRYVFDPKKAVHQS